MRKILFSIITIIFIIVIIIILSKPKVTNDNSGKLQTVTLAMDWTPNTNHTGIYVALEKGWYKEENIDLTILPFTSNLSPDVMVATKKADVGISSTEGVVTDAALGSPVVSIAAIVESNTSALIALADSGIHHTRDLDGKIYGGFGAPYEEAVIKEIIKKDGGEGTFQNVILDVDAMQALETGKIDFVWVFMGWDVINAERKGLKLVVFPINKHGIPDYATPNFITHPDAVAERSKNIQKFMNVTRKGYEFAILHPEEAAKILIKQAPKGTFPDESFVMESQKYLSSRYALKGQPWGKQTKESWTAYPSFMLKQGAIKDAKGEIVASLDFTKLFSNVFVE